MAFAQIREAPAFLPSIGRPTGQSRNGLERMAVLTTKRDGERVTFDFRDKTR